MVGAWAPQVPYLISSKTQVLQCPLYPLPHSLLWPPDSLLAASCGSLEARYFPASLRLSPSTGGAFPPPPAGLSPPGDLFSSGHSLYHD